MSDAGGKKIYRGNDGDIAKYWMTTLKGVDAQHPFEEASSLTCSKKEPKRAAKKSYREILRDQKSGGGGGMRNDSQHTYELNAVFVNSEDETKTLSRSYVGTEQESHGLNQFILLDHSSYYTAHPIAKVVNFNLKITEEGIDGRALPPIMKAATDGDITSLEKHMEKFKLKEIKQDREAIRMKRTASTFIEAMESKGEIINPKTGDASASADGSTVGKKKKKSNDNDEDWGTSALNVGAVRKAEHDWDFEEGSVATDDEGDVGIEDEEEKDRADVDQFVGEEVSDSSNKGSEEDLDETGQNIKDAIDKAELRAADAELDQFSDDSEEESITEGGAEGQKTQAKATGERANAPQLSKMKTVQDPLKTRIIGSLQRRGNSMPTKEFMAKFVRTKDTKDPQFIAIQKCIRELCAVIKKKDPSSGVTSNYLQLKADYRN